MTTSKKIDLETLIWVYLEDFGDFYGYDFNTNQLARAAWIEALAKALAPEDLANAFRWAIAEFKFKPSPNEFIAYYKSRTRLSPETKAWEEWKGILAAIKAPEIALQLSSEAELALDALGGFTAITELEGKNNAFTAKEFVRLWLMYRQELEKGTIKPPTKKILPARQSTTYYEPPDFEPISPEVWAYYRSKINSLTKEMPKAEEDDADSN